jgi:flagellar basal body P-ring formation protein FlgA
MTFNISLNMSIVENPDMHRTIARIFYSQQPGLIFALLMSLSITARADWQDDIRQQLLGDWQAIAGPQADASISFPGISSTYQLQECQQPPTLNLGKPLQPGRNSLEIRCAQPWWQQYVALQLHSWRNVAILTRAMNNGDALTADSIRWVRQDVGELNQGFFTSADELQGQTVKRTLKAGTILNPDQVQPALLVRRGDTLRIKLRRGNIQLQTDGTAQEDGRQGERIRIRNNQSGKNLTAIVIAAGEVEIH